jgi:hypothetical protein
LATLNKFCLSIRSQGQTIVLNVGWKFIVCVCVPMAH